MCRRNQYLSNIYVDWTTQSRLNKSIEVVHATMGQLNLEEESDVTTVLVFYVNGKKVRKSTSNLKLFYIRTDSKQIS